MLNEIGMFAGVVLVFLSIGFHFWHFKWIAMPSGRLHGQHSLRTSAAVEVGAFIGVYCGLAVYTFSAGYPELLFFMQPVFIAVGAAVLLFAAAGLVCALLADMINSWKERRHS